MTYLTENPALFEKFQPKIDAYNKDKEDQIKAFDADLVAKCEQLIPSAKVLDSEAVEGLDFLQQLLSKKDLQIVNEYTIKELVDKQVSGELSAVEIAQAYIRAAIVANYVTNYALQFLIPEALEQAKSLDKHLKDTGALVGPFHGVPISIKEQMCYKNKVTHASYVSYIDNVSEESSVSVDILMKLGAVCHVRTSQPQTIMHLDTWNNFIGRTRNPRSTKLSPGGSSGGESACVGMHASAIGHGSDIGGSIRAPAAFANLFGIRPTTKRISLLNGISGGKGQESVVAVQGPLARSIDELDYFMKAYLNEGKPWCYDPSAIPIPWREPSLPDVINIGILPTDNLVTPYPSITRGIRHVADVLSKDPRFNVIDLSDNWYSEEEMKDLYDTTLSLYTCDGNQVQLSMLEPSGEPILPLTKHFLEFGGGKTHSIYSNRMMNAKRDAAKVNIMNKYFNDLKLDLILTPTNVAPAEIPGESYYWGYTSLWNLVDYPNVVFPTGLKHDVEVDSKVPESLNSNEYEKKVWYNDDGSIRYNSKEYENAPIALQLTGKRFCDEDVVAATKIISELLNVRRT
ncbi:unnamed protein product [Kluyveromyces dobzhanskii CBS 2104]|uniref:amidase n=1 Tax=Kluyveromyces dobzhanskii CBS 2104 TaxID=1427455 RepID=A0A0A8L2F9_9SACH|nr:unnamed protein product [Kluyveromyces dobzhanskii CBS 2104]